MTASTKPAYGSERSRTNPAPTDAAVEGADHVDAVPIEIPGRRGGRATAVMVAVMGRNLCRG
jgi:hypothetical protein